MGVLRSGAGLLCCLIVVAIVIGAVGIARSRNRPK
jgi:hypothetical protein